MTPTAKRFNKNAYPILYSLPMVDLITIVMQLVMSQIKMARILFLVKTLSILK